MFLTQIIMNAFDSTAQRSLNSANQQSNPIAQRGLTPIGEQSDPIAQRGLTPIGEQPDPIAQRGLTPVGEQPDSIAQRGLTPVEEQFEEFDPIAQRGLTPIGEQSDPIAQRGLTPIGEQSDPIAQRGLTPVGEQFEEFDSIARRGLTPVEQLYPEHSDINSLSRESTDATLVGNFSNDSLINRTDSTSYTRSSNFEEPNPIVTYSVVDESDMDGAYYAVQANFGSEQIMEIYGLSSQSTLVMDASENSDRFNSNQLLITDSFLNLHSALNALIIRSGLS